MQQFRQALKLMPDDPDLSYALGLAYASKRLYRQAVKSFKDALTFDPEHTNAQTALAIAESKLKK